ncbi:MAG: isoprenylcysteine carboxylmethyltransferase family protein [Flavobacteriales bacterium]|jgi:protein-S-isoprenylcysteine O-methyltransferase Ste14|nr:isoprenylcysteine carboxylmethyltransferase family protein [Flavobacteriales bacterium]
MSLVDSREKQGNFLFKYRGQFPVILFVLAVPFIYYSEEPLSSEKQICNYIALCISVVGFLIRFYTIGTTPKGTSGRNTKEQIADYLNSTGIYSTVRHPLYLGNYFIWAGIAVFTYNIYFIVIMSLLFWVYYKRIMFAEEQFLERKFGEEYSNWSKGVPAFIPSCKNYIKTIIPFSVKSILRREYAGVLATVIGFVFVEVVRESFINKHLSDSPFYRNILIATILVVLLLRSLKHYTTILEEKDRS